MSKNLSLAGGPHHLYWEPLIGALVETTEGWVLLDTGMSRAAHQDEANTAAYREGCRGAGNEATPWHLYPPAPDDAFTWGKGGDPMATALAEVGLRPEDLALAAVSHLHVDHSGGIPALARAGVPVAIQRRELDFARSGAVGVADGFFAPDWSEPGTTWRILDDEEELAPGVTALSTPGHTPGHQSFRIDLPRTGVWILSGDAADLGQNFLDDVACGSCAGGTAADERNAAESVRTLLETARRADARLIPGHDQLVFNAVRHPAGGHR